MNGVRKYYFLFFACVLFLLFLQNTGCQKEYSFEGADTASVAPDTLPPHPVVQSIFPECALCHAADEVITGTWNFKTSNSYVCGTLTNSGFIGGNSRTDFTFFGPSACSHDTGIVVSAYLPVTLDQDRFNITTNTAAYYYYDNTATQDIFISRQQAGFTVTVKSYFYATGIATGTFSGTVFKPDGDAAYITDGQFKIKL